MNIMEELYQVILNRQKEPQDGSYTNYLLDAGTEKIAKKFGEESSECIIEAVAGNRDRFLYEACDVMYHYLVLLEQMGVSLSDIEKELALRHR